MSRAPLFPDRLKPLLFAHRGCSSLAPENTWASFKKAQELQAPGIELDVHLCRSGELVVAHDDTFARTGGDPRAIEKLAFKEIKTIEVGSFFGPAFKREYPPVLEEVLEAFCPDMYVDIELKTRRILGDPLPEAVAKKLTALGSKVLQSVSISSFNPFSLAAFKRFCPLIPTALIWSADPEVPAILRHGFGRFIASCDYLKPVHLQAAEFAGQQTYPLVPWTIDDPAQAETMLHLGCAGIITNRPQDIRAVCSAHTAPVTREAPKFVTVLS